MITDVNYIREILAFNGSLLTNDLSAGQIALWYALVYVNNSCKWEKWFTVSNKTLENQTGLSKSGIAKAREALREKGYIDYEENGTKATGYHVNYVFAADEQENGKESVQESGRESSQESVQESSQESGQESGRESKRESVQDSVRNCTPLNKINKTKIYNIAQTHVNPKNRFNNFHQRDSNVDDLEMKLLSNII